MCEALRVCRECAQEFVGPKYIVIGFIPFTSIN